jgi:thiosulfate/3-mercaptopyruvate sulfurtransferase
MRRRSIAVVLVLLVVGAPTVLAGGDRDSMIVSVAWLASHLKDPNLVLLHVGTREGYDAAHIPGARYVTTADLSLPRTEGALVLELPPVETLKAAFEKLGVSDSSRVVVYFGDDWVSPTARVYFTLDYLGFGDRASILDGGLREWRAGNHPVTAEVPAVTPGHLTPKPRSDLVVDAAWVKASLKTPKVAIVDARNEEYYDGATAGEGMRAGHIPGAKSLPFEKLVVEPQLTFVGASAMRELFRAAGLAPGDTVVPYCHIGQQASLVYFAARYLGYDVRLYDGSFQDWSRRADFPVVSNGAAAAPSPH